MEKKTSTIEDGKENNEQSARIAVAHSGSVIGRNLLTWNGCEVAGAALISCSTPREQLHPYPNPPQADIDTNDLSPLLLVFIPWVKAHSLTGSRNVNFFLYVCEDFFFIILFDSVCYFVLIKLAEMFLYIMLF
ncbi:hypothetical protein NPIL_369361 [Nephila pilipes]|uniref:Uncharacterized protein n=1 Tax=Nephila pilipes TaxID=299642 RepID=A0A8X6QY85_NEPPI|nr:hypothetical protein NPIL_369361 [Nephila pilipes]